MNNKKIASKLVKLARKLLASKMTIEIYDRNTSEPLISAQQPLGVYQFSKDHKPMQFYVNMDEAVRLLEKIERSTHRKVTMVEL